MTRLFDELKTGLQEAIDHAAGRPMAARVRTVLVTRTEVQNARMAAGLTQEQFASVTGASLDTIRKWEQGARRPSGAAARLIKIIAARPEIVPEILGVPVPSKRAPRAGSRRERRRSAAG